MISSKELIRSLRAMGGCWSEKGCAQHVKDNGDCDGCRDMLAAADLIERLDGALGEQRSYYETALQDVVDSLTHEHAIEIARNTRSGEGE